MSISDGFPYAVARSQQQEIFDFIAKNEDKKVFLINAPTGVGKSGIAIALSKYFGKSYILTETKALQDQYTEEFPKDVKSIKGKSSYTCNLSKQYRVDEAPCNGHEDTKKLCKARSICAYYNAYASAFISDIAITNYDFILGLSHQMEGNEIARECVICDEGHVLEDKLVRQASFEINPKTLNERYSVDVDPELNFQSFEDDEKLITHIISCITERIKLLNDNLSNIRRSNVTNADGQVTEVDSKEIKLKKTIDTLTSHKTRMVSYLDSLVWDDSEWISEYSEDGSTLIVTPFRVKDLFKKFFYEKICSSSGKIFIMSASLGDFDTIINEFELDQNDVACIDVDTPFDPEKSPVAIMPRVRLGWKDFENNKHDLLEIVDAILDEHPDEKGIIHSGNTKTAMWIAEQTAHKARVIYKERDVRVDNTDLFLIHASDPRPTVLISPSMHTGIDLKGDLAKFQIIAKLPFANMKDVRVKAKMNKDKLWYANQTWQKIIQACGRATRSEDDESITYIIDNAVTYQYNMFKSHLPIWFKNRLFKV